jgi:putative membrane-bound dehydrogenase-like protein
MVALSAQKVETNALNWSGKYSMSYLILKSNMHKKTRLSAAIPVVAAICTIVSCQEAQKSKYDEGLTPEESIKKFELKEGFAIEAFATEPYVQSPVDMVMDENGNVYVVEMGDYPWQADTINPKGLIKFLKDTDGDGKIDTSVVFADKLPSATSIMPWKGGLLVAAAPEVFYLKDTTGDYKADIKEVVFTGFFDRNSEAQITSFRFGIDNWIYANNNGQAGSVSRTDNPAAGKISVGGGDFRFRMDNNKFETESGNGQFGLALDDWGNRFFSQNTLYIQQAPIAGRYLKRHPYLTSTRGSVKIYEDDVMFQRTPPPYWRAERSARRQRNYDSLGLDRVEWPEGHFTGASGGTYYGGDAFPEEYYGSIFTAEVAGNLVHRTVLKTNPGKAEFEATRGKGEEKAEFLASTDSWFRPTVLYTAPDGYLYLVDMYMQHIETPVSIPDDLKADMDFEKGSDMGRIYRIYPKNGEKRDLKNVNLGSKTTAELVTYLSHPNSWWRLTAQRLILERQDKSILPALKEQFATHEDPRARLHSLYAIDGLGGMDASLAKAALKDPVAGVRVHGAILSERFSQNLPDLIELAKDADDRVALQAALSLGQFQGAQVQESLAAILTKYSSQPLYRTAVLSSNVGSSLAFVNYLAKQSFFGSKEGSNNFLEDAAFAIGARGNLSELSSLLSAVPSFEASSQKAIAAGLEKGFKKAPAATKKSASLVKALESASAKAADDAKAGFTKIQEALK